MVQLYSVVSGATLRCYRWCSVIDVTVLSVVHRYSIIGGEMLQCYKWWCYSVIGGAALQCYTVISGAVMCEVVGIVYSVIGAGEPCVGGARGQQAGVQAQAGGSAGGSACGRPAFDAHLFLCVASRSHRFSAARCVYTALSLIPSPWRTLCKSRVSV